MRRADALLPRPKRTAPHASRDPLPPPRGAAANTQYDGRALAEAHDVVVVSVQYRLGVFGWLADSLLRPRDPAGSTGNYGLLDNIEALSWLQRNLAAFGGDPARVTLFGESSGAGSISQLLGVEAAWPYFHRAIMESGTGAFWTCAAYPPPPTPRPRHPYQTHPASSATAASPLNQVPLRRRRQAELRRRRRRHRVQGGWHAARLPARGALQRGGRRGGLGPVSRRVHVGAGGGRRARQGAHGRGVRPPSPAICTGVPRALLLFPSPSPTPPPRTRRPCPTLFTLLRCPRQVARAGGLRPKTPIIAGFNLNDGASFVPGWPLSAATMSSKGLTSYFTDRFGDFAAPTLAKEFPVPAGTVSPLLSKYFYSAQSCETDFSYSCTAEWVASAADISGHSYAFVYQFSEPTYMESLAVHGDEIGYVFGTLKSPSPSQGTVSKLMMAYWTNFAKEGTVNGGELPEWPQWSEKGGALLNITASPTVAFTPNNSFVGCPVFDANWDYFGGCLPP